MAPYIEITRVESSGPIIRSTDGDIQIEADLDTKRVTAVTSSDPDLEAMLPEDFGDTVLFRPDGRGPIIYNGERVTKVKIEKRTNGLSSDPGLFVTDVKHTVGGWLSSVVNALKP